MLSKSELLALGKPDPKFAQVLAHIKATTGDAPLDNPNETLLDRREQFAAASKAAAGTTPDDIDQREFLIAMPDDYQSPAIVVKAKSHDSITPKPLILLFFGGGFVSGIPLQMVPYARTLVRLLGAVVVCGSYRLAPEHLFPAAPQDAYAVLEWCAQHGRSELGAEPEGAGFVVGGVSAGANLAAVVAAMSVEKGLKPRVSGVWAAVPPFYTEGKAVPEGFQGAWISMEQNAVVEGGLSGKRDVNLVNETLKCDETSPLWNPLQTKAPLKDLPKTYVQVCGMDPLRDDGLIYADALEKAGVPVRLDIYPGQVHAFWVFYQNLTASKKAMLDIVQGMAWLVGRPPVDESEVMNAMQMAAAG